jgi:ferredoxin-NADP reductase
MAADPNIPLRIAASAHATKGIRLFELRAPRNDFPLVASPAGYTFIAGGIGITPIMSMIRQLKRTGGKFKLYYCTRSKEVSYAAEATLKHVISAGRITYPRCQSPACSTSTLVS